MASQHGEEVLSGQEAGLQTNARAGIPAIDNAAARLGEFHRPFPCTRSSISRFIDRHTQRPQRADVLQRVHSADDECLMLPTPSASAVRMMARCVIDLSPGRRVSLPRSGLPV